MSKIRTIVGIAALLCVLALIAAPASAVFPHFEKGDCSRKLPNADGPEMSRDSDGHRGMHITGLLDHLEEQGFDVSEIRSAVESGDFETARTLMHQFMEAHGEELPDRPHPEMNR